MLGLFAKKEISNEEAMKRFQNGNAGSFDILLERHSGGVLRFVMKMTGGNKANAEDLLQEVFLKVIERRSRYDSEQKFTTWLYSIARNHCIDYLRSESYRRHSSLDAPISGKQEGVGVVLELVRSEDRGQEDNIYNHEVGELLDKSVKTLKEEFKEVFLLKEVEGLTLNEIAEITRAPLGTVKSRLRYAYKNLRKVLNESGYFEEREKVKGV